MVKAYTFDDHLHESLKNREFAEEYFRTFKEDISSLQAVVEEQRKTLGYVCNVTQAAPSGSVGNSLFSECQAALSLTPSEALKKSPQGVDEELRLLRELERHARLNHMDWNVDGVLGQLDALQAGNGRGE